MTGLIYIRARPVLARERAMIHSKGDRPRQGHFALGGFGIGFPPRPRCVWSRSSFGEPVWEVWPGVVCCRLPEDFGLPGVVAVVARGVEGIFELPL